MLKIFTAIMLLTSLVSCHAQNDIIRNPSFEEGVNDPDDWTLNMPPGEWHSEGYTGDHAISVTGEAPEANNFWTQRNVPVEPGMTYRFSFWARSLPGASGGCIVSGPDVCNNDTNVGENWEQVNFVFVAPTNSNLVNVRLGHWYKTGTVMFDDVSITPVQPVHRTVNNLTLGAGEEIQNGHYRFTAPLSGEGRNYSRPLHDLNINFNTNRWVFNPGGYLVYRHSLSDTAFTGMNVKCQVNHYEAGICLVDVSRDGQEWVEVAQTGQKGPLEFSVPDALLPADELYIRFRNPGQQEIRPDFNPGSFQINQYEVDAEIDNELPDCTGETTFLNVNRTADNLQVSPQDFGSLKPGKDNNIALTIKNSLGQSRTLQATVKILKDNRQQAINTTPVTVPANSEINTNLPYDITTTGNHQLQLTITEDTNSLYEAETNFTVPVLYDADYGYALQGDDTSDLWWCEGTYKVSQKRPIPSGAITPGLKLSAARNEYEPVQLVLQPHEDLTNFTASVSNLTGPNGAVITADGDLDTEGKIEVCQVWYHEVTVPTDKEGCKDWWPDALPPLTEPVDLAAGRNHPLWITVKVPDNAPAGTYSGTVEMQADGWTKQVPLTLQVWNFTLPNAPSLGSAFGLDINTAYQYQNINSEEDRQRVWDLYLENFREHRIAPYSFWRHGIDVQLNGIGWTGGEVVSGDAAEGDKCLRLEDNFDSRTVDASCLDKIEIETQALYTLSFWAKTAEVGQQYLVTFLSYDNAGQWISGHNNDIAFTGDGTWKHETLTFMPGERSPDAMSLSLVLRPTLWTETGVLMGTVWFDDLKLTVEGSENNLLPDSTFEDISGNVSIDVDFAAWDLEAEKYLDEYGFKYFSLPVTGMGSGTFYERSYGQLGPYQQGTDEYRRLMKQYLGQVETHLREKGWLDKAYVYWFDEPEPRDYDFVKEGMEELHLAAPGIQRMLTEEPNEELAGYVDIWCPILNAFSSESATKRQAAGDSIWWYVCTGPKEPWPTLFTDHSAVDLRVWLWMTWQCNVEAILVWTSNYWHSPCAYPEGNQNPWTDPMSYVSGYGTPIGERQYWGNGDGRFIYPPNRDVNNDQQTYVEGPVNSIRWEMLREGIEDYEYFTLLKRLATERNDTEALQLLDVPEAIYSNLTSFSKNPQNMYQHREKLALAIERLSK